MAVSEPTYDIQVERGVPVPMRDGTVLRADVYRPQGEGQFPVLVGRVGYKLRDWDMDFYTPTGEYYTRRGYVVVWQNVRGAFASGGQFYPFWDDAWGENRDGYDTVEWAASQPWSNGKAGMLGASYSGLTQYLTAPTHPPHLEALFVQMGWGSARNTLFRGGGPTASLIAPGGRWAWCYNIFRTRPRPRVWKPPGLDWRRPWGRWKAGTGTCRSSHSHRWRAWLTGISSN